MTDISDPGPRMNNTNTWTLPVVGDAFCTLLCVHTVFLHNEGTPDVLGELAYVSSSRESGLDSLTNLLACLQPVWLSLTDSALLAVMSLCFHITEINKSQCELFVHLL